MRPTNWTRLAVPALAVIAVLLAPGHDARAAATVFTQTYAASTAAGGTLMTSGNAATVTVTRAGLRDTVSNTGNSVSFPFRGSSNTAFRGQFLVEQAQVGYGGVIDSLGWKLNAAGSAVTFSNFTVKLVHTLHNHSGNTITTTFATNYDSNTPVTVFGPATLTVPAHAAGDLLMLDLANTFTYDNASNLIVEVTWSNAAATSDVAVVSNTDNGQNRWNVTATGSTTATTGSLGKDADYFVLRMAGDTKVVNPFDGTNKSVTAGTGSTYAYGATSTGSGATQRWMTNSTLTGSVATSTISKVFYQQFLPSITLAGTAAGNTVSTTAHTQFGASAAGAGKFGTFSEWADKASTLTFSASTTPQGLVTTDTRTFTVSSALAATIHYLDTTFPAVTVSSPNGGESWGMGSSHNITWTATDNVGVSAVDLAYSTDGGSTYPNVIATGLANSGSYAWTVPNVASASVRVRATARDAASNATTDASNANFTIADLGAPTATLTSPNGGEVWTEGSPHNIAWTASDDVGVTAVDLDYSVDNGSHWTAVAAGLANSGSYSWTVPGRPTVKALVRVTAHDGAGHATSDASDALFRVRHVSPPGVTMIAPVGGEQWEVNSAQDIRWAATDSVGVDSVCIEYSINSGGAWYPVAANLPNTGSYSWTVPGPGSIHALVRVTAVNPFDNRGSGQTPAPFAITTLTPVLMSGLMVEAGHGFVEVRWSAFFEGAPDFQVQRSATRDGGYQPVGDVIHGGGRTDFAFRDAGARPSTEYYYRVSYGRPGEWAFTAPLKVATPAAVFAIRGVTPNPSGGRTSVSFEIARSGRATVAVYDLSGRRVRTLLDAELDAGSSSVTWDGRDEAGARAAGGIYFVRLESGGTALTRRVTLVR